MRRLTNPRTLARWTTTFLFRQLLTRNLRKVEIEFPLPVKQCQIQVTKQFLFRIIDAFEVLMFYDFYGTHCI